MKNGPLIGQRGFVPAGRLGVPPNDKLPGLLLGRTELLLANEEPKLRPPLVPPLKPAPELCTALVRWLNVRESGSDVPMMHYEQEFTMQERRI